MKCDELKDYDYDPNFPFQSRGRFYIADEVDAAIAELKAENERLEKCCKEYDIRQRIDERIKFNGAKKLRATKRALWLAREWRAWCEGQFWLVIESNKPRDIYHLLCTNRIHRTPNEWMTYWQKVEQLCKKKVEAYK